MGQGVCTIHFYLNTMLIAVGVGWGVGGACFRSLLLEHNAHWGGVGWGMGACYRPLLLEHNAHWGGVGYCPTLQITTGQEIGEAKDLR